MFFQKNALFFTARMPSLFFLFSHATINSRIKTEKSDGMNYEDQYTFNLFLKEAKALKSKYQRTLAPFFNASEIRRWRAFIYSMKAETWKKDRAWEFMNGDFAFEELEKLQRGKK